MKRILVLNYEFPPLGGGASPVSYELAKKLSETGEYDIDVVTMGYKDLKHYEEVNKNFRIHRVKCLRTKKEICHPWEQATYLVSAWFKCKELLKKNKYDICHTHFIIPTGVLALKLKKKYGLEYVITSHGSDVLGYNPRFKKLYPLLINTWKKILDNSKMIVTPSNFLKNEILKVYPDYNPDKIAVIPNGIEDGKFVPMQKEKYILIVSRLTINKGVQDFIEAIKDIDLGEWNVKIVGEGPYKKDLESLVDKYNLGNKVEFLGWVDNKSQKMKELYGKASIFVLASWFENFNTTLLEAMQAGCRVLATNVGGNPEIVANRGDLFPKKDIEIMKKKIVEALELVSITSESFTVNRYSLTYIIENYTNIYEKN
jgi:glycosyltransferase involved in cell wall biosynthesis